MRISVQYPTGLTDSIYIKACAVYVSETKFTSANLPEPFLSYTYSNYSYILDLPKYNVPYWVMFEYTGSDNKRIFGPPVCMLELEAVERRVFGGMSKLLYGDGINGMFPAILTGDDVIYPDMFKSSPNDPIKFVNGNAPISWFLVNSVISGNTALCNMTTVKATDLYAAGYLGRADGQQPVYSSAMMAKLGPTVVQGRTKETMTMRWSAHVPTLDEFRERFGVIFQSDIPTNTLPISTLVMEPNRWYLTSTEDPNKPGNFYAMSSAGTVTSYAADSSTGLYLMFRGKSIW